MCYRVRCKTCKKYTYRGCGIESHIAWVKSFIAPDEECTCVNVDHSDDDDVVEEGFTAKEIEVAWQ